MSNIEMKTPSGGSATIKPLDRLTNEDFNLPVKGGTLLTEEEMGIILHPSITGSITLNGTTNNTVDMTDIVTALGLETGDVIRIDTGAYNKLHTVESITNNNSIIVNYEHAGNRGNGSLKLPDSTGQATVTRIAKWFNAPIGLGQDWVDMAASRVLSTTYTNSTGRPIQLSIPGHFSYGNYVFYINDTQVEAFNSGTIYWVFKIANIIPDGATYKMVGSELTIGGWLELR